jgi:hypothetical protein
LTKEKIFAFYFTPLAMTNFRWNVDVNNIIPTMLWQRIKLKRRKYLHNIEQGFQWTVKG